MVKYLDNVNEDDTRLPKGLRAIVSGPSGIGEGNNLASF